MEAEKIKEIKEYLDMGLPIIPLCTHDHTGMPEWHTSKCHAPGKKALIKGWTEITETTNKDCQNWMNQFGDFNIGLVLGNNSGYVGVDIDGDEGEDLFLDLSEGDIPDTWQFSTGAGRRLLYTLPAGVKTKKNKVLGDGIHQECAFLCDGQYTVMPPSTHHNGTQYSWIVSPQDMDCADAPEWLLALITENVESLPTQQKDVGAKISLLDDMAALFVSAPPDFSMPSVMTDNLNKANNRGKNGKKPTIITAEILQKEINEGERDVMMTQIVGHFCAKHRSLGKDYVMMLALWHNQQKCTPPLPEESIQVKVNTFWDAEVGKDTQHKNKRQDREDKKEYIPRDVAQAALNGLENEGYVFKINPNNGNVFICHKDYGPWKDLNLRTGVLRTQILDYLTEESLGGVGEWGTEARKINVLNTFTELLVKNPNYHLVIEDEHTGDVDALMHHKYIPTKNGQLFNWQTMEEEPWDPECLLFYTLDIDFEPDANCSFWQGLLRDWLPDSQDRLRAQEFAGYMLVPYMGFEKFAILQGGGANGKTIFLRTLCNIIGSRNLSYMSLKQIIKEKFLTEGLFGKVANICEEAAETYLEGATADSIKNLVSGGVVKADRKNQTALEFKNTAKFMFSTNNPIRAKDISEGWWRRVEILPFDQFIPVEKRIGPDIMHKKLRAEYTGILNWMVEGLLRLAANNGFTKSALSDAIKEEYQDVDIDMSFWNNCIEVLPKELIGEFSVTQRPGIETTFLRDLYICWAEFKEVDLKRPKNRLNELMHRQKIKSDRTKSNIFGIPNMCFIGLKVQIKDQEFINFLADVAESSSVLEIKQGNCTKFREMALIAQKEVS